MKSNASYKITPGLAVFLVLIGFSVFVHFWAASAEESDISTRQQVWMKASQMIQYGNALSDGINEKDMVKRYMVPPRKACVQDTCAYEVSADQKFLRLSGITGAVCADIKQLDPASRKARCVQQKGQNDFVFRL